MKKLTCALILFSIIGAVSNCLAKSINLYDQPKADSKVVSTLDSNAGVITIFTPKEGGWVKVADPRNGNVGWVKSADLNGVSMHYNVMQTGDKPQGFQVMQYGNTSALTPEQIENMRKKIQAQQQAIQKNITKMMNDMFNSGSQYWVSFPMIMPVVVVPEKTVPADKNQTTSDKK